MINGEYRPGDDIRASDDQLASLHVTAQAALTELADYDREIVTNEDVRFYGFPPTGEAYESLPIMDTPPGRIADLSPELVRRVAPHAAALLGIHGGVSIEQDLPYLYCDAGDSYQYEPVAAESHFFIARKGKGSIAYALQGPLEQPSGSVEGWCSAPVYEGPEADYDIRLQECNALQDIVAGWAALVRKGGAYSRDNRFWQLPDIRPRRRASRRQRP